MIIDINPPEVSMPLVNRPAPNLTVPAWIDGDIRPFKLSEARAGGAWTVLFFYPKDFTFVCPTELVGFQQHLPAFRALNAVVLGASTDTAECHRAWVTHDPQLVGLSYPLLGDQKKELAAAFDVLDAAEGIALRGTFILDPAGTVRWMQVHDFDTGREIGEILRVLQAMQTGGLTACAWKPGDAPLTPG
jgi:alkyl hydroperoxide reductase subunit AhpC